jgi:hypothetical protein
MKSLIKYFLLLLLFGSYLSCNNPQPTALVEDEDPIAIEVINKNPAEPTSFGVDSTGLEDNPARFTNVISVAGIKQTFNGISLKSSFAQAVFFDKTKPVWGQNGKLVGYSTLTPGNVFFNNIKAERRQFKVKYGITRDTSLGLHYVVHKRGFLGDSFDFEFSSKIDFRFVPDFSSPTSFDIATPPEIFLNYRFSGSKDNKNLNLVLDWNAGFINNFEILISIVDDKRGIVFPLYKIKTADDGKFVMPKNLLEELAAKFNKIAFTLTRKYEKRHNSGVSELFVVSQSINSISVELP